MPDTLLLHAPVALHRAGDTLLLEDQACNGLRLWAEHFEHLVVMMPLNPAPPPPAWVPVAGLGPVLERIEFITLPWAYRPDQFLRALPEGRRLLRAAIERCDYLGFAIGGLFGDWGAVGAWQAHRMGKPFYIWTDRVESEVVRRLTDPRLAPDLPWRRRLRARLEHRPMAMLERALIRRAALGLFHGRETFDTYAPHCRNPQLVHDIHLKPADHIAPEALARKIAEAGAGPLRITYVGRAEAMKGTGDWLAALEALARQGVDFRARWLGEGPDLAAMRARVAAGPLAGRVELPGFLRDRAAVLEALRRSHLMLFCHQTPESPRCLIEALASGCPIVGHDSAFPADLIAGHGGGWLTPPGDTEALAGALATLAQDRARLAGLIGAAARDGAPFTDAEVFRHRAELIREHLPRAR